MATKSQFFSGSITSVLYENEDFRIAKILLDEDQRALPISIKGSFPAQDVQIGSWVAFEGHWHDDPQYGRQLNVTRSPVTINNWSDERVLAALSANGVGPTIRWNLDQTAKAQGRPLFELLESGDLTGVPSLDDFTRLHTLTRWQSLRTHIDAASFMAEAGLSSSVVSKIWKTFGSDLQTIITEDPWVLVRVAGVSFAEADQIALRLGVPLTNPGRLRGAVLAAVQETVQEGHVFATTGQIVDWVRRTIPGNTQVSAPDIASALRDLFDQKSLMAERSVKPGLTAIYDSWHGKLEKFCAEELVARLNQGSDEKYLRANYVKVGDKIREAEIVGEPLQVLAEIAIENWSIGHRLSLSPEQKDAVTQALTRPIHLLSGLPGTGKTTSLEAIVAISRDAGIPILLVAPTGIAAKRMSSITGTEALTVHRAFGARGFLQDGSDREATYVGVVGESVKKSKSEGGGEEWGYGPKNPHPAKFIVVDESSMLDLHMLYRILQSTSRDCRILFVGDQFQLPSVGSGDVLRDLISSKVFSHSHLDRIFRQVGTSGIVVAAHEVHGGRAPKPDGTDFVLIPADEEDSAAEEIVELAKKLYDRRLNFQVLSPRHGGDSGVTNLNSRLRMALNPASAGVADLKIGSALMREGDRIMVVKNDYELNVYNGDVGKVSRIDRKAKQIELKIFEGPGEPPRFVPFKFSDAGKALRLAYAQTVHKSQGQEYDIIILPMLTSFGGQLQRNLLYTAITRAKKKVFVVGSSSALGRAVRNNQSEGRNTLLAERIIQLLGG